MTSPIVCQIFSSGIRFTTCLLQGITMDEELYCWKMDFFFSFFIHTNRGLCASMNELDMGI